MSTGSKERIQKLLAHIGLGSRREIERWITEGRVSVNQQVAKLGDQIDLNDIVTIDGNQVLLELHTEVPSRLLRFNKPEGIMCTAQDPQGRPIVFDFLPELPAGRWIMVGRLDLNTSGLLLFTTDGALANQLMHPSTQIEREYAVRVFGEVTPQMIETLLSGVTLDDGPAKFSSITPQGGEGMNRWYDCTLAEGRNREVRRMWAALNLEVSRLMRKRYGSFVLGDLPSGTFEEVPFSEIAALRESLKRHNPCSK
jgi:23S rRNA pseudouridine2605 synthase